MDYEMGGFLLLQMLVSTKYSTCFKDEMDPKVALEVVFMFIGLFFFFNRGL